ncbi:MAG: c-type cytochrome [Planctomycetales bacterium]|nr:c-type cytochrome [Planctomycetales bacterium]
MIRRLKELSILVLLLICVGAVIVVSGIFPIKASSGHWPLTAWVLDFASDRSVAFHSRGIRVPPLDEPGMVSLGAVIYETNCAFCHGQPGKSLPHVARGLTPSPPLLTAVADEKEPQELFYIVQHGIKFTGMPAWPAQERADEIWPVIAFLQALPTMDAASYEAHLAPTSLGDGDSLSTYVTAHCAACHGFAGDKRLNRRIPMLAGQSKEYLLQTLRAYRAGERKSGVMGPLAHRLDERQLSQLAEYFSQQAGGGPESTEEFGAAADSADTALHARGKTLVLRGDDAAKIASCADCHGPGEVSRCAHYPTLAGQPAWYIQAQLELLAKRQRGGGVDVTLMHAIADKLDERDRRAVAHFYSRLPTP